MIVLALDTSTAQAGLALYDAAADRPLYTLSWLSRRQQTRELAVQIGAALEACALAPTKVGMVAVATGPGSFTGVRIGISVAKGMALGARTDTVTVGVPTMSIMLAPLYRQAEALACPATLVTVLPAGRDRFLWTARASRNPNRHPAPDEHRLGPVADMIGFLERSRENGERVWISGEWTPEVRAAVLSLPHVAELSPMGPARSPAVLARLAWTRWQTDPGCTDPGHLAPLYVSSQ